MRNEDRLAKELESQGLIVIRTFKHDCPDVVAFPADIASHILAKTVKSSPGQISSLEALRKLGVQADVYIPAPVKKGRGNYFTSEERKVRKQTKLDLERQYEKMGGEAYLVGRPRTSPECHGKPGQSIRYATKRCWIYGWEQEQEKHLGGNRATFADISSQKD